MQSAVLTNALATSALAVAGIFATIAGALGRNTGGRIVIVVALIFGIAFLIFTAFTTSIYLRGKPEQMVPPSLRNRPDSVI